ncbi:hypothetical protein ER308_18650 [Egibacter rhizosphaerae]|uniref:Uncharacterized protein n=1 Tax=Egibacter rhizosphaerae TaxID=1670831 RepID=A0A411YJI9_9ACTN|nr:hypothetical protein [Egibacter rhizosphaerae]QBI21387.1 hypothetical protein ER308_18650 [Egibacter rhizosphaerae]
MTRTRVSFEARPLPEPAAAVLRERLEAAHQDRPLSTFDVRHTARRVARIAEDIGFRPTIYRGGLDLRGIEVDHVWLDIDGHVVDAAFPLFLDRFVLTLRDWVAGDASDDDLVAAAEGAGVGDRVLGEFPTRVRYLGSPIWSARRR